MQKVPITALRIIAIAAIAIALAGTGWFFFGRAPEGRESGKLAVVTTLFPLYDFAREIGGDKAEIKLLLPPGVEAHSFDPRPSDIAAINRSDVFVYTGKFMEPWAADLSASLPPSVRIVDASAGITLQPSEFNDEDEPAGASDPHVWLDFSNDKIIIAGILAAMSERDPDNSGYYRANARSYEEKLDRLDSDFRAGLDDCESRELIYGGHYALGYLARRYGLSYSAAQGVSPDAEPTAQDLVSLIDQIRRDRIEYIFYEELTSPKIAQTVASETGAKMLPMNAAHNISREELEKGTSFIAIMEEDLANLKIGLRCRAK